MEEYKDKKSCTPNAWCGCYQRMASRGTQGGGFGELPSAMPVMGQYSKVFAGRCDNRMVDGGWWMMDGGHLPGQMGDAKKHWSWGRACEWRQGLWNRKEGVSGEVLETWLREMENCFFAPGWWLEGSPSLNRTWRPFLRTPTVLEGSNNKPDTKLRAKSMGLLLWIP